MIQLTQKITTVPELLKRARSAADHKTIYDLGAGGMDPDALYPWDAEKGCDCSGFVCWSLGISRQTKNPAAVKFNGGWWSTDGILADAMSNAPGGMFTRVMRAEPGVIAVYGKAPGRSYGHVGIVTEATPDGRIKEIIHCSSGNYRRGGDAIQETPPTSFRATDMIFCTYDPLGIVAAATAPAIPVRTWVLVASSSLNLRRTPDTTTNPIGSLKRGERALVAALTLAGQNVDGNAVWYQALGGEWLWAGGTDRPNPELRS